MKLAFISGTGLNAWELFKDKKEQRVETPYGGAALYRSLYLDQEIYFLPRHGPGHNIAPHLINYRANIAALKILGVEETLAFCSVGSLDRDIRPGSLVFLRQFIDMTWGRESTFVACGKIGHVVMDEPYCPRLTDRLLQIAKENAIPVRDGGVYICTQGPRFETAAEIRAYASWGANLVGMTGVPEAALAKEAGLCYSSLSVVANYAAGLVGKIDSRQIEKETNKQQQYLERLMAAFVEAKAVKRDCRCRETALAAAGFGE